MKLELNLWFNPRNTNGTLNINAGEYTYKFNNFFDFKPFIYKGIDLGIGNEEELNLIAENLNLDKNAKFVWINENIFIAWNNRNSFVQVFYNGTLHRLEYNKAYQQTTAKHRPHASYKVIL